MSYTFELGTEDILDTYIGDETTAALEYAEVMQRARRSDTAASIARDLMMEPRRVARYLSGSKPRGLKGVEELEGLGLFPTGLEHENFDLFHTLSCITYWRGFVAERNESQSTLANTVWSPTTPEQRDFMEAFLNRANIPYRNITKGGISLPNEVSRLMLASGHGVGEKSSSEGTVPRYIQTAVESYSEESSERHLALITDFVRSMIFFRLKEYGDESLVHLFSLRDEDRAAAQGELIWRSVQIGLPNVKTTLRGPYPSEGTFHYRIGFPVDQIVSSIKSTYAEEALRKLAP